MPISPTWRRDRYDVNSANVNRQITIRVQAVTAPVTDTFAVLKGPANQYPAYHQVQGANEDLELAQIRTSLVVRALSQYAVPVGVHVFDPAGGASVPGIYGSVLDIKYEVDEMGVFFNQEWTIDATQPKHGQAGTIINPTHHPAATSDDVIQDTVGTGGMPRGPKEKPGLNLLLDSLATVTWDPAGLEGPFGALSVVGAGVITLPDGSQTAAAAALPPGNDVNGNARTSGLEAIWIGY